MYNQNHDSVIKGLGIYIPPFCVDINDLANSYAASEKDIIALKEIIGPHESIAVVDMTYMDIVVLALNAFEKMRRTSASLDLPTDYTNVQMILGGTEDPPDKSKPTMALAIQEHFGLPRNIFLEHNAVACSVGGNMLLNARNFTVLNPGLEAIVAMADIARYNPHYKNAEKKLATAGAGGAVFQVGSADLDKDYWLIQLPEPGSEGLYAQSFQDFWMPNGAHYPEVNGLLSCWCYHLGFLGAVNDHFKKLDEAEGKKKSLGERLAGYNMVVMHIPFINQVRDSFCLLYSNRIDETIEALEKAIDKEAQHPEDEEHKKLLFDVIKAAIKAPGAMDEFNRLTGYWQDLPPQIGNLYSASLPASFVYGLQNMENVSEPFDALLVFFGSGLQAIAMSVKVHPRAIEYAKELDVVEMINEENRILISAEDYVKNIKEENSWPLTHNFCRLPLQGYFRRKRRVVRGYPEYSRIQH